DPLCARTTPTRPESRRPLRLFVCQATNGCGEISVRLVLTKSQRARTLIQWSGQKSGGDSAVSSEFVIAGVIFHIPSLLVVEHVPAHRKPPEVRIWRLSSQSRVGTVPPSTSTPHWPACWARR